MMAGYDSPMLSCARLLSLTLSALVATATAGFAAEQDQIDFFETKIRPVLAEKCYSCHSVAAEAKKNEYRVKDIVRAVALSNLMRKR